VAAVNRPPTGPAGEPQGERPVDVARIARALRAGAPAIAIGVIAVTLIAFVLSLVVSDRYRATARIVTDTSAASATSADTDQRRLATNVALLTTPDVLAQAARKVPGESADSLRDKISTSVATDADVIDVTATDSSAAGAAAIANAVARAFLDDRAAGERADIAKAQAALEAQLTGLGAGAASADQAAAIRTRLSELVVDGANAGNDLQLAELAQPPSSAYAPRPLRNAAIAFFAALFVAILAVVLRERLRPAPEERGSFERLAGVPLLATLPEAAPASRLQDLVRRGPRGMAKRRAMADEVRRAEVVAATAEGIRTLLGAVLLALPPGDRHVIVVTSARRTQATAGLAARLARALAQAGQETLALETDLSSPALAEALGVEGAPGLAQALDQARAGTAVRLRAAAVPDLPTLHVVPGGGTPGDGVGLLRPGAVDALFMALGGAGYDYVVVDAPGLLSAPEAWLVARNAEAAVVVCEERPSPEELAEVRRSLERLDVRVLGAVSVGSLAPAATPAPAAEPAMLDEAPTTNGDGAPAAEERLMLERLRAADAPLTFSELRVALGEPPAARVRTRLRGLVERGDIERRGSGQRGDPYLYVPRER
jgi:capsular polysaccharide biosynthesis protein/MinD-like ATPase involved in chromosome partitioning or flagellar assembly